MPQRIDVEILDVGEARAILDAQPRHHRDALVAVTNRRHREAVDRRHRRQRHFEVRHAGDAGAVGIDGEPDLETVRAPVVAHAVGDRHRPQRRLELIGEVAERIDALAGDANRHGNADRLAGLELTHVDTRAGNLRR